MAMMPRLRTITALLAVCCAAGCGHNGYPGYDPSVVGGACVNDGYCAPGAHCQTGGDLPGGTCTLPCASTFDCAPSSVCVDKHGGICLLSCGDDSWCRPGYRCKSTKDRGDGAESLVCIK
jgi:hypothetical protein